MQTEKPFYIEIDTRHAVTRPKKPSSATEWMAVRNDSVYVTDGSIMANLENVPMRALPMELQLVTARLNEPNKGERFTLRDGHRSIIENLQAKRLFPVEGHTEATPLNLYQHTEHGRYQFLQKESGDIIMFNADFLASLLWLLGVSSKGNWEPIRFYTFNTTGAIVVTVGDGPIDERRQGLIMPVDYYWQGKTSINKALALLLDTN